MDRSWRTVVVLASYNEARSISAVLAELKEAEIVLAPSQVELEVLLVDDNSPDGTGDVKKQAGARRLGLELRVVTGGARGWADAMLRGLAAALELDPTAVVTLDGDGQHNPVDIPMLFPPPRARHADITIGSRWARGDGRPGRRSAGRRARGSATGCSVP